MNIIGILRYSFIIFFQVLFLANGVPLLQDSDVKGAQQTPSCPQTARATNETPPSASASRAPSPEQIKRETRAYHDHPPTRSLPATLDAVEFKDNPKGFVAYSIAARIPELLYQQPCYCHCDKNEGHESLFDCYTRQHAVRCFACQSEAILIFEQSKMGKTVAAIRAALARGEWTTVDVDKYAEAHRAEFCNPRHKANPAATPGTETAQNQRCFKREQ